MMGLSEIVFISIQTCEKIMNTKWNYWIFIINHTSVDIMLGNMTIIIWSHYAVLVTKKNMLSTMFCSMMKMIVYYVNFILVIVV